MLAAVAGKGQLRPAVAWDVNGGIAPMPVIGLDARFSAVEGPVSRKEEKPSCCLRRINDHCQPVIVTIEALPQPGNSIVSGRCGGGRCSRRDAITRNDELILGAPFGPIGRVRIMAGRLGTRDSARSPAVMQARSAMHWIADRDENVLSAGAEAGSRLFEVVAYITPANGTELLR
jgi:hypothetical protein